jgi:hypothetical protein
MKRSKLNKFYLVWLTCLMVIGISDLSFGAWYDFGKQKGVPEINELRMGRIELESLPDLLSMTTDDLDGGVMIIRGLAEISEGKIGAVQVSFDGGTSWEKANLDANGLFNFEFRPDLDREYLFVIKAIATTGKSSEPEDATFPFIIASDRSEDQLKEVFYAMLANYMNENAAGFISSVSEDFEGDLSALEEAIDNDFAYLNNINIAATISRISQLGNSYEITFIFDRTVQSANTGQNLTDNAASSMTFKRTDGMFKLISMAAPLIFGVSDTSEVATDVASSSVGQEVLVVNEEGEAVQTTQTDDVEETVAGAESDIRTGSATLTGTIPPASDGTADYFVVESQTVGDADGEDIFHGDYDGNFSSVQVNIPGPLVFLTNDATIKDLGAGTLSDHTAAPESGYQESTPGDPMEATTGHVYAIKTDEPLYALIQVTAMTPATNPAANPIQHSLTFQYKVQMSGTRSF